MDIFLFLLFFFSLFHSASAAFSPVRVRSIERFPLFFHKLSEWKSDSELKIQAHLSAWITLGPFNQEQKSQNHKRKWWKASPTVCSSLFLESRSEDRHCCHCCFSKKKTHCFLSKHVAFRGRKKGDYYCHWNNCQQFKSLKELASQNGSPSGPAPCIQQWLNGDFIKECKMSGRIYYLYQKIFFIFKSLLIKDFLRWGCSYEFIDFQ